MENKEYDDDDDDDRSTLIDFVEHDDDDEIMQSSSDDDDSKLLDDVQNAHIPYMAQIAMFAIVFSDAFATTTLFSFVSFQVEDFGVKDVDVGYYASWLAGAFYFGQFVSSYPLSRLSDRVGRKPVLMVGMSLIAVSIVLLGFAVNFWMALAARLIGGLLNADFPIIKAWVGNMCSAHPVFRANPTVGSREKSKYFGIIGVGWGVAGVLGPALGGILVQPVLKNPDWFGDDYDGWLAQFPYCLPTLLSACLSLIAIALCYFYLPETIRNGQLLGVDASISVELKTTVNADSDEDEKTEKKKKTGRAKSAIKATLASLKLKKTSTAESEQTTGLLDDDGDGDEEEAVTATTTTSVVDMDDSNAVYDIFDAQRSDDGAMPYEDDSTAAAEPVFFTRQVSVSLACYCVLALTVVCLDEVFPMWAMLQPKDGGIGFTSSDIGYSWVPIGVVLMLFQLFIYHRLATRFGALMLFRAGMAVLCVIMALYPTLNMLAFVSRVALWLGVIPLVAARGLGATLSFTSANILLNASTDEVFLGRLNGSASAIGGLARALAPFVGGNLLAWSVNNGLGFPLNHYLVFLLLSIVAAGNVGLTYALPKSFQRSN
jgi:MFS family permease